MGKVQALFDETRQLAILGIANEGSEKIAHQVWIKLKAGRDDDLDKDADPVIQATACGQVSGESVAPSSAALQSLALDPGEGGDIGSNSSLGSYLEGPQVCTSFAMIYYNCDSVSTYENRLLAGIQTYNSIAQVGAYPMLAHRDTDSIPLLIGGVPQLDRSSFESLKARAAEAYIEAQEGIDPRLKEYLNKMMQVRSEDLAQWMQLLQQAIRQGSFEQEYTRLLGEGLSYVEQALVALGVTTQQARQIIYNLANQGWTPLVLDQRGFPQVQAQ